MALRGAAKSLNRKGVNDCALLILRVKIVLAVGNTKGVAQVENKIVVANSRIEILRRAVGRHALEDRGAAIRTRQGRQIPRNL